MLQLCPASHSAQVSIYPMRLGADSSPHMAGSATGSNLVAGVYVRGLLWLSLVWVDLGIPPAKLASASWVLSYTQREGTRYYVSSSIPGRRRSDSEKLLKFSALHRCHGPGWVVKDGAAVSLLSVIKSRDCRPPAASDIRMPGSKPTTVFLTSSRSAIFPI